MSKIIEKFYDSLFRINEFIKEGTNSEKNLNLFLKALSDIYNNNNYRTVLQDLYDANPKMTTVSDDVANVVFVLNGSLPDIRDAFSEDSEGYENLVAFNFNVQEQATDILLEVYPENLQYDDEEDVITLLGVLDQ